MTKTPIPAIVLLSGGLDSTTVLAMAKEQGFSVYALSFHYGQRNSFEANIAATIAHDFKVTDHKIATIDLRAFGGSSLTSEQAVEKNRTIDQIGREIPSTYVPARNTIFLAYALAWAEVIPARDIFIGVNAVDTSGYPDCRPEYIEAFCNLANIASKYDQTTKSELKIHAPLQHLSKSEIIKIGTKLGVDYSMTNSCYDPIIFPKSDTIEAHFQPCGACDACILRQKGFLEAGLSDPLNYS